MPTNIIEDMNNKKNISRWDLTSEELKKLQRENYLKTITKPLPLYCPECNSQLQSTIDEDETICTHCGLVTSGSIEYVGLKKIVYPHGRH